MQKLAIAPLLKKTWVKIALSVVVLFFVAVLLVPVFVSGDTFRPALEKQLSAALGRQVTLGHLSFSLLSSRLEADNIAIADDPAYSSSPFLQAASLRIGVEAGAFLFSHRLSVTNFAIESPSIQLIQNQNGAWNFSSIGGSAPTPTSSQPTAIPDFTVALLSITNGSATVSSIPATGKTFVYSKLNLSVHDFSLSNSFPFQLSASLPGDGTFQLKGSAGPLARSNAEATPFNATLDLKHFDPVAAGIVEANQGISTVADFTAQLASNGKVITSTGKIHADKLRLMRSGAPSPKPIEIDYTVSDSLDARTGQISDLAIHTGFVIVHVKGDLNLAGQAVALNLHVSAPNLPIDQLEQLLPVVGVQLPSGSSLKGGTLTASLAVTGPVTSPTITGPIDIENTQLVGFDLGSKIGGLTNPGGNNGSGGTAIQFLKTTVTSTAQATQFANIEASIPAIGTATGSGAVSAAEDLNFNMTANIKALSAITGAAGAATSQVTGLVGTQVTGLVGGLFGKKGAVQAPAKSKSTGGIPLTITGKASNPQIRLNTNAFFK